MHLICNKISKSFSNARRMAEIEQMVSLPLVGCTGHLIVKWVGRVSTEMADGSCLLKKKVPLEFCLVAQARAQLIV